MQEKKSDPVGRALSSPLPSPPPAYRSDRRGGVGRGRLDRGLGRIVRRMAASGASIRNTPGTVSAAPETAIMRQTRHESRQRDWVTLDGSVEWQYHKWLGEPAREEPESSGAHGAVQACFSHSTRHAVRRLWHIPQPEKLELDLSRSS